MSASAHSMDEQAEALRNCEVAVCLAESHGIDRTGETVTVGVPLPESLVFAPQELGLVNEAGELVESCYVKTAAQWPDGSLKWVHVHFTAVMGANQISNLCLVKRDAGSADKVQLEAVRVGEAETVSDVATNGMLDVSFGGLKLLANKGDDALKLLDRQGKPLADFSLRCQLAPPYADFVIAVPEGDADAFPSLTLPVRRLELLENNPVFSRVLLEYEYRQPRSRAKNDEVLGDVDFRVEQLLTFHHQNGALQHSITLHNPRGAHHQNGFWDLGGPGSIWIKSIDLVCKFEELQNCTLQLAGPVGADSPTDSGQASPVAPALTETQTVNAGFDLYQESSGGENWQSRVHVNNNNKVPLTFSGYRLQIDEEAAVSGERADPIVHFSGAGNASGGLGFYYRRFWQAFPSQMKFDNQAFTISLLPGDFPEIHELQGGEKLTKEIWCAPADSLDALTWLRAPLIPSLDETYWKSVNHLHFFDNERGDNPYTPLIECSLEGPSSFFAKRERYDEYGWRNFGELFADHESWPLEEGFNVSHYNNQYDAVYSFGLQFLLTGDERWFILMDDLVRHVLDIDIYHTDKDREEFAGAAFWHTDHYMDAYTATHRAHSTLQTEAHGKLHGGCFSQQHCYTAGLSLHYFLTGSSQSRDAVTRLTESTLLLENRPATLIGTLRNVVSNEIGRIREIRANGSSLGYSHPIDRGTGNLVVTLINAYEVTGDHSWIEKAATTIRETLHPADDIELREFADVETRWSYAVFLYALTRFMSHKEQENSLDESYWYARESFVSYMRWVLANEVPYLECANGLEHINCTWPAQDSRKNYLLHQAAYYDPDNEAAYLAKAESIMEHIQSQLCDSPQLPYTRIQVLLLQNFCQHKTVQSDDIRFATHEFDLGQPPSPTIGGEAKTACKKLVKALLQVSPSREYRYVWSQLKLN